MVVDHVAPDPCRLRLRGGVSRRTRLPRLAHQPDLRRHQRNQSPDHHRLADEARHAGPVAAAAGHQAADGRSDGRPGARWKSGKDRWPPSTSCWPAPRSSPCSPPARPRRSTCRAWPDQQEVMGALADCIIEVYAMESCLLRAEKLLAAGGRVRGEASHRHDAVYVAKPSRRVELSARKVIGAVARRRHAADPDGHLAPPGQTRPGQYHCSRTANRRACAGGWPLQLVALPAY